MNAILAICTVVATLSVLTCPEPTTAHASTDSSVMRMEMSTNLARDVVSISFIIFCVNIDQYIRCFFSQARRNWQYCQ